MKIQKVWAVVDTEIRPRQPDITTICWYKSSFVKRAQRRACYGVKKPQNETFEPFALVPWKQWLEAKAALEAAKGVK